MGASGGVKLVVQSDDFGMCHAVNTGTVEAFVDGIVTQTTMMVPCPWFDEAVTLAHEHDIPVGVHLTLTCEWDNLRWRPMTGGRSLVADDGTFHRTVEAASAALDHAETVTELRAQVDRFIDAGLAINHLCPHMGMVATEAYGEIAERYAAPFLYPGVSRSLAFTSITFLSDRDDKLAFLLRRLGKLAPGVHLLNAHCGTPSDELRSITGPGSAPFLYAEAYRRTDLEVLTHPDVLAAIDDLGIELTTSAAAFA
jgi:chitin disaccharide deacetylase